jgi:hypothetical protein
MALVKNNLILHGISGMLGDQVVIRQDQQGDYVLAARPAKKKNRKYSLAQQDQQERFRKAALYGKATQGKPEYQALAKDRRLTAYTVATKDYLTPPDILDIDISGYTGGLGQPIVILAVDDVKVAAVKVLLAQDDSTLIEQGLALVDPADPHRFVYTATKTAPTPMVAISVDVIDLAGNATPGTAHT